MDEKKFRSLFQKCGDVIIQNVSFSGYQILFAFCQGMVKKEMLDSVIFIKLKNFIEDYKDISKEVIQEYFPVTGLEWVDNKDKIMSAIFSGKAVVVIEEINSVFSIDIANIPNRKPEETKTEVTIQGPRDNFIEDLTINIGLIRKRLRTTSLCVESLEIGKRSKTKVAVLYIQDIADQSILKQLMKKLQSVDIDSIYSGNQLKELIDDRPFAIFPQSLYTGRPDFVVQSLLSGRFSVLIDGVAYSILTPANLFFTLKTGEDSETSYLYNSFERTMRIVGLVFSTLLPGFWVAITSFHQNQIPFTLLATLVESRKGVPLPSALEAILMLLLFELFREAGLRMPLPIGQTLSVVGGLIIGDAAIRAGLTSALMLVVIGASTVATFTLANQALIGTVSLLRFGVLLFSGLFGFPGFFIALFFILLYLARIRTFGVPYLEIATRISFRNIVHEIFRLPAKVNTIRPHAFTPKSNDNTRTGRKKK
ncbi:spore germination protein [Ectobacillus polymachus]|uniref:spore germination protein n=1 Tax=Ectobacillus polymachus TaxID=1508806 RepID=UPI003A8C05B6